MHVVFTAPHVFGYFISFKCNLWLSIIESLSGSSTVINGILSYGLENDDGAIIIGGRWSVLLGEVTVAGVDSGDRHNINVVNTDPVSGLTNWRHHKSGSALHLDKNGWATQAEWRESKVIRATREW